MKTALMFLYLSLASLAAHADDSMFGSYSNGKVQIKIVENGRGGTHIYSSLCKGYLHPSYTTEEMLVNYKNESPYAIGFGGNSIHIDVEGENKCLPEGRYKRVSSKRP